MRDTRPPGAPPPKGNRGVGEVGEADEVGEGAPKMRWPSVKVGPEDGVDERSAGDEVGEEIGRAHV